jgi:hypothetical protein
MSQSNESNKDRTNQKPYYDRLIEDLKNNPFVAWFLVIFLVLGGIVTLVNPVKELFFSNKSGSKKEIVNKKSDEDSNSTAIHDQKDDSLFKGREEVTNKSETNSLQESIQNKPRENEKSEATKPLADKTKDKVSDVKEDPANVVNDTKVDNQQTIPGNVSNQSKGEGSPKDTKCIENNTGDYCFHNTLDKTIYVYVFETISVWYTSEKTSGYKTHNLKTIILQPNQTKCINNCLVESAFQFAAYSEMQSYSQTDLVIKQDKSMIDTGDILIEKCKSQTYSIK